MGCVFFAGKVVFRSGQGALQVLPPLVDVIPEARLNLVIYHLRQGDSLLTAYKMHVIILVNEYCVIMVKLFLVA